MAHLPAHRRVGRRSGLTAEDAAAAAEGRCRPPIFDNTVPEIAGKRAGGADIDIFTWTTTFAIMQSIRIDRGPSGPVHP